MKARGLPVYLFLLCVAMRSGYCQMSHVGMSSEQQFLLCAQGVLGKPVLWQALFPRAPQDGLVPQVTCPDSREHFIEALQKNEAISVFEDDRFAFLAKTGESPAQRGRNIYYGYDWKRLAIDFHAITHPVAGSQDLSDAEQSAVVSSILRNTRGVEVFDVIEPSEAYGSDTGLLHVWLDIDIVRLGRDTPESVFAFLHASTSADSGHDDVVRLLYGEMRQGTYVPLWDSPLMYAPHRWISYRDLDGDGIKEILIWLPHAEMEQLQEYVENHFQNETGLISFDKNGHELTRQAGSLCEHDNACPIMARRFSLVPSASGRRTDIIVHGWVEHPQKTVRLRLRNGSFYYAVAAKPHGSSRSRIRQSR